MPSSDPFKQRIMDLLVEISAGECSITDEMLIAEENPEARTILAGLLLLHEEVQYALKQSDEARRSAEMASVAKSEFLAMMSHEIRTPLSAVIGMVDLLARTQLGPVQAGYVSAVRSSSQVLMAVMDDVLDLSRFDQGSLELRLHPFDPRQIVREVTYPLREPARSKGLALMTKIRDDVPAWLLGDAVRIQQVLGNLLSNAVQFSDQGIVELTVERRGQTRGGHDVRFEVRDTGLGIAPADLERIFQPFAQIDGSPSRALRGAGLGLTVCRRIVDRMGGQLDVWSSPGEGSTFFFTLKLADAEPPPKGPVRAGVTPERGSPAVESKAGGLGAILLVEDDGANQEVMQSMLGTLEVSVDLASNGAEAVRAHAARGYDLILMDCRMPGMDGWDATRAIRQMPRRGDVPIIALTASAAADERQRSEDAGMNDFLAKPVRLATLQECVRRWLRDL